jgi:hypothetical protein
MEQPRNLECMNSTPTKLPSSPKFTDVKESSCGIVSSTELRNSIRIKRIERSTKSSNSKCLNQSDFGYYSNDIPVN